MTKLEQDMMNQDFSDMEKFEDYEPLDTNDKLILHGYDLEKINIKEFKRWYETNYSKENYNHESLYDCIEAFLYWHENISIVIFGG